MNTPDPREAAPSTVHALVDFRTLWTTHDVVTATGVASPAGRRVIDPLHPEPRSITLAQPLSGLSYTRARRPESCLPTGARATQTGAN
jgi:hypothetical protein